MTEEHAFCPVHASINVLQEKWTLHIIRNLLEGPRGFNELGRAIGGCNPATLAQRLEHLEKLGIVKKTVHSVMPPRTAYELAPAGAALQGVIIAIDHWARRYLRMPPGAPGRGPAPGVSRRVRGEADNARARRLTRAPSSPSAD